MKHTGFMKTLAIVLAACALTVAVVSALGIVVLARSGLYAISDEQWYNAYYEDRGNALATAMAESYAARSLSGFSKEELEYLGWGNPWQIIGQWQGLSATQWSYRITDGGNVVLESNYRNSFETYESYTFNLQVEYPVKVSSDSDWIDRRAVYSQGEVSHTLYMTYNVSPEYEITIWLASDVFEEYNGISLEWYDFLTDIRYSLIYALAAGLVMLVACLVYLFCAAGKKQTGDTPSPGGLNKLPLDIYAAVTVVVSGFAFLAAVEILEECAYYGTTTPWFLPILAIGCIYFAALFVVGFLFALAAQWKMHGFYVWHNSLIGRSWRKLWKAISIAIKGLCKLYGMLPLVWRYLLIGLAMGFFPLWFFYLAAVGQSFWVFFLALACLCDLAIIAYGAYAYGTVLQGAQKMAAGELYFKVDTKYLAGEYKTCGEHLNALADVAVIAAKKQMQSDRMKTELITNVSHDIKTPLTSIINYIDLLQKAETQEQSAEYLQVLDRQSQGLKKLIDDLIEMSKAATGNVAVELDRVDAVEAINQALGEFSDKFAAQDLTVVFRQPEASVPIMADGRLLWRVLSNLLSNVVKYALPGTRVYMDMCIRQSQVEISLKNISREALNVPAEELIERFVRGDASRNAEGSGLGLNIAKSLMELQKGNLELVVDGDLFKVTLTFPAQ